MRRVSALLLAMLFAAGAASAQPVPQGSEFAVNTYTTNFQSHPRVVTDASGGFVVVWQSYGQDGSRHGIFARRYDSSGAPLDTPEFLVNSYTTENQYGPSVAADASGNFIVAWGSYDQDGSSGGAYARRFTSGGTPLDVDAFRLNTYTTDAQSYPVVSIAPSGDFIVVWQSNGQDGSDRGVFGRRYDVTGAPIDLSEFQVNTYTSDTQYRPVVATGASGDFVVAWSSREQDGDGFGVFARRYDSAGAPFDAQEFAVNTHTTGQQHRAAVAMNAAGDFLVAWQSDISGLGSFIDGRRFTSAGASIDAQEIRLSAPGHGGLSPSAAFDPNGGFVVVWQTTLDGSGYGVFGRTFTSGGAAVETTEFQVNTYTRFNQYLPTLSIGASGDFVVTWQSELQEGPAGAGTGIFAQRLSPTFGGGGCPDADGDGICDTLDVVATGPPGGTTLDCSDPKVIRPTFSWTPGNYDRFKVSLSSGSGFSAGTVVTSGGRLLALPLWAPTPKKWKAACAKAHAANPGSPVLFLRISGRDLAAAKTDPDRDTLSQVLQYPVAP